MTQETVWKDWFDEHGAWSKFDDTGKREYLPGGQQQIHDMRDAANALGSVLCEDGRQTIADEEQLAVGPPWRKGCLR